MDLPKFLALLRRTPRRWEYYSVRDSDEQINLNGAIRMKVDTYHKCCPITALDEDRPRPARYYKEVADDLKLSDQLRIEIVAAADNDYTSSSFRPYVRDKLIKACGLKPYQP